MPPSETSRRTDTKLFQCRICKTSFSKNEHLARHVRSHTKEKPFVCTDCGNRYSRQSTNSRRRDILLRHRRDVKCRPSDRHITVDRDTSSPTEPKDTSYTSHPTFHTPEPQRPIPAVSGNAQQPAQAPINNSSPQVREFSFAPPQNSATWMESNPITSTNPVIAEDSNPQMDQFGLGGFDLSGFDVLQHIDAGLREEISATEVSSSQRPQLFQTTQSRPFSPTSSLSQSVQHLWFTTIAENLFPTTAMQTLDQVPELLSPESSITTINENHRQSIYNRLQIFTYEPTIPSIDLLNVSLRLYFAKVHSIFPLVHAATFQPCRENADLVIAMCAIGGLFTGSDQGLQQGIYLFERVHKATLHNWEQLLARGREELIIAIQSAAISQLFGLLSGNAHLLMTVDAFHGPPIAWSRYLHLYSRPAITHIDADVDGHELEKLWHDWARNEEIMRVAHGLFIIDAELGGTLHHEPIQTWKAYKVPSACSEKAFLASNAQDWKSIYLEDLKRSQVLKTPPLVSDSSRVPETSNLTTYAALENISSQVLLRRSYEEACQKNFGDTHVSFSDVHHRILQCCLPNRLFQSAQEPLQLRVLQSLIYMEALVDFNLLERIVGRDGPNLTTDELSSVTAWANSMNGKRCILHAIIIKRHVEERSITSEPALHIPRAVFWAGLALFCYIRFGTSPRPFQPSTRLDFPEFSSMGINLQVLVSELDLPNSHALLPLKLAFFSIIDFLQHVGHWRITKRFAAILSALGSSAFGSTS